MQRIPDICEMRIGSDFREGIGWKDSGRHGW